MAEIAPFPTFLIIGAERCGTRWLRFNLDQHPDICASPRVLDWFSDPERMTRLGTRWYRDQFATWDGEAQLCDFVPTALSHNADPTSLCRRIEYALPDARLIAIIRHPLERLESAANRAVQMGEVPPGISLWTLVNDEEHRHVGHRLMTNGVYSLGLRVFTEAFGDRLLVLVHDEICQDRAAAYRTVLRHLGIDEDIVPADLDRRRFGDGPRTVVPFDPEQRDQIFTYYGPSITITEQIIGRELVTWRPEGVITELAG